MAKITQIQCDRCGAIKQETNHWFVAFISRIKRIAMVAPLGTRLVDGDGGTPLTERHLCGQGCVVNEVSEVLGGEVEQCQSTNSQS